MSPSGPASRSAHLPEVASTRRRKRPRPRSDPRIIAVVGSVALVVAAVLPTDLRGQNHQVPGATVSVLDTARFKTEKQSMWGAGHSPGTIDLTFLQLGPYTWNVNGSDGDTITVEVGDITVGDFGGSAGIESKGHLELYARMVITDPGEVDVNYPIRAKLTVPERNSFKDGDWISIRSEYSILQDFGSGPRADSAWIVTRRPKSMVEVGGKFGLSFSAGMTLCVFECTDLFGLEGLEAPNGFKTSLTPDDVVLFRLTSDGGFSIPPLLQLLSQIPDGDPFGLGHNCGLLECEQLASFQILPFNLVNDMPFGQSLSTGNNPALQVPTPWCTEFGNPTSLWPGHGLSGTLDVPKVSTSSTVRPDKALEATGHHQFINVALDADQWYASFLELVSCIPNLSSLTGETLPVNDISSVVSNFPGAGSTEFQASYNTVDISVPLGVTERQKYTFAPSFKLRISFAPQVVEYEVLDPGGVVVSAGSSTQVEFALGNTLRIRFPQGRKTPMDAGSRYAIQNSFTNDQYLDFSIGLNEKIGELDFQLTLPKKEIISGITVDPCLLDPLGWFGPTSCPKEIGEIAFPGVNVGFHVPEGPGGLYNIGLPPAVQTASKFSGGWSLQDFIAQTGHGFVLDPENPSIAVSSDELKSGLATGTGPVHSLVQELVVTNTGDVQLLYTQVVDALSKKFGLPGFSTAVTPVCPSGRLAGPVCILSISRAALAPNGTFDGVDPGGDPYTLAGEIKDTLDADPDESGSGAGGAARLRVAFLAEPGNIYTSDVDAEGRSRLDTKVTASADPRRHAVFPFEIGPDLLADPSADDYEAMLPVEILSTHELDATAIDPATVRLEGIPAERWSLEPRDGDPRLVDLTLKFDRKTLRDLVLTKLAPLSDAATELVRDLTIRAGEIRLLAEAVLGRAQVVDQDLIERADLLGNQNNRLDVGDLRAAIATAGTIGPAMVREPKERTELWLSVLGMMTDGTTLPFMGEFKMIFK